MTTRSNAQLETQLLAEWWATLPPTWPNKTHVNVGSQYLTYQGAALSPARQAAFGTWNDWADMRIYTFSEIWIVEAKIVNTGGGYGQLLDYLDEYPTSLDIQQFVPTPVVGILLCAYQRSRTAALFSRQGIRTIVYTPSWASDTLANKVFGAGQAG